MVPYPRPGRLALDRTRDTEMAAVPRGSDAAAVLDGGSLACLTHTLVRRGETPDKRRSGFIAPPTVPQDNSSPSSSSLPSAPGTSRCAATANPGWPCIPPAADRDLPAGHVLGKWHSRMVSTGPSRSRPDGSRTGKAGGAPGAHRQSALRVFPPTAAGAHTRPSTAIPAGEQAHGGWSHSTPTLLVRPGQGTCGTEPEVRSGSVGPHREGTAGGRGGRFPLRPPCGP